MTIENEIDARGISEILHFTTNRGVTGSLFKRVLMSRPHLNVDQHLRHVLQLNWGIRPEEDAFFDKSESWINFVNLSISEINARLFKLSKDRHTASDLWWCILGFDPKIMSHDGVWFATTNNGYDACSRGKGQIGLQALFGPTVQRKFSGPYGSWSVSRGLRSSELPTCEQAEVLYPDQLSLEYLRKIYVIEDEHHDIITGLLVDFDYENIEVLVEPNKFWGQKN